MDYHHPFSQKNMLSCDDDAASIREDRNIEDSE
jgi:hypothetical protein